MWVVWTFMGLSGIGGIGPCFQAVTFGRAEDVTTPETRTGIFRLLRAFNFLGVAVGPLLGGLLSLISPIAAAAGAVGCFTISIVAVLCMDETHQPGSWDDSAEREANWKEFNPRKPFADILGALHARFPTAGFSPNSMAYMCLLFASFFAPLMNLPAPRSLYVSHEAAFGDVSLLAKSSLFSINYIAAFLVIAVLIPGVSPMLGLDTSSVGYHAGVIRFSSVAMVLTFAACALAPTTMAAFFILAAFGGFMNCGLPSIKFLISGAVEPAQQGLMLWALANAEVLVQLATPLAVGEIYSKSQDFCPQLVFIFLGGLGVIYVGLALRLRTRQVPAICVVCV
jgi:hypothetical protein